MSTRITFVGAGSVARRHAGVLTGLGGVEVVGVFDPSADAAAQLAGECGADAYASLEQALDDTAPDAVYICVPPFAHGAPERAVVARGLPFFVEKPVGTDLPVPEEVGRLVAESGLVTGTGYHWRCLDTVDRAREAWAGRPPLLATGYWLDKRPPVPWWGRRNLSGGQVVEQLTHVLDLARVLLGEATEVYAAGAHSTGEAGAAGDEVDDVTAATVRFESGAVATFAATSLLRAKHRAGLDLFGPGLVAELSETLLTLDDGHDRRDFEPSEDPRITVDREFLEAVRGERATTRAPYAEALRTHRLGCAITESARTGSAVRLGDHLARVG
jgi:predicted dehydrogenase